jgi:hypothetical protein
VIISTSVKARYVGVLYSCSEDVCSAGRPSGSEMACIVCVYMIDKRC